MPPKPSLKKTLKLSLISSLTLLLSSCSSVDIKDNEWCVIAGIDGAYCFHTLSDKERDLTYDEWKFVSRGWLAGSPEAFANLKEAIDKLCSDAKCNYEIEQLVQSVFKKVDAAQTKAEPVVPLLLQGG
jgi:hypothetical protein